MRPASFFLVFCFVPFVRLSIARGTPSVLGVPQRGKALCNRTIARFVLPCDGFRKSRALARCACTFDSQFCPPILLTQQQEQQQQELHIQAFAQPGKRARLVELVQPDVRGIQEVAHRLSQGQNVAVPTECTYELLQQHSAAPSQLRSTTAHGHKVTPHVYVTDISALETSSFWKQLLVKKAYAIKNSATAASPAPPRRARSNSMISTTTADTDLHPSAIATFNETIQVIRRIAPKVWPGPVILYVQISQPVAGLSVTVGSSGEQCYTSESKVQHYLALRMACHPLTVKVCKEFYQQQSSPPPSPGLRPKASPDSPPSLLRSTSSSSLLSVLSASQVLVGFPLRDNGSSYVTTAEQVTDSATTTVLNGEERREIFAVPTCERGQPCQVSVWMDADRRTVRVQRTRRKPRSQSKAEQRMSPDSVMGGDFISESSLTQSLRGTNLKPKNAVDRVIQAVLLKWKVIEDQHHG